MTFHLPRSGVGSTLPAASMARTWILCLPYFRCFSRSGELHGLNFFEVSILHSKCEPASLEANPITAVRLKPVFGFLVKVVSGGITSEVLISSVGCAPSHPPSVAVSSLTNRFHVPLGEEPFNT